MAKMTNNSKDVKPRKRDAKCPKNRSRLPQETKPPKGDTEWPQIVAWGQFKYKICTVNYCQEQKRHIAQSDPHSKSLSPERWRCAVSRLLSCDLGSIHLNQKELLTGLCRVVTEEPNPTLLFFFPWTSQQLCAKGQIFIFYCKPYISFHKDKRFFLQNLTYAWVLWFDLKHMWRTPSIIKP